MSLLSKKALKDLLGGLPLTAEVYWYLRQTGKPVSPDFSLHRLQKVFGKWSAEAQSAAQGSTPGKNIFIFATLRYWIEHAALLGLALAGQGQQVTLAYLPYGKWYRPIDRFNLRRQNLYAQSVLRQAEPLMHILPLLNVRKGRSLPPELARAVQAVTLRDTQYTFQVEEVDPGSELYQRRFQRNEEAARSALTWFGAHRPDLIVIPNGTILEFGILYQIARFLNIPVVTYEFGEQRKRIWLAQGSEVMRQETDALWQARKAQSLSQEQWAQVRELFASRQRGSLWENFTFRWQGVPGVGGEKVRTSLGLDERPVVLLATNVIGDSLTLGRQVFSDSMTEWLERTIRFFASRPELQFVIRIHPGELITKGPSVAGVVQRLLPEIPPHIHLVAADAQVNTYDIVEIADFGLVYTTTVGMEMAMSGVPVIVVGNTHYRNKGFTLDPASWEGYFDLLDHILDSPADYRPTRQQVELAWNYAYRFFFEYPQPFPWHIQHMRKDTEEWPLKRVLDPEGQEQFGKTFRYLAGEPILW